MLYKIFSSLKTSVFILAFMILIFLVGTIFPQGRDIDAYIEAGGKYVALVRTMDFLDIFMSPLFLFVTGVLVVNLAVCLYDRLRIFLSIRRKPMEFDRLKEHPNVVILREIDVEKRLIGIGFRLKAKNEGHPEVKIFEKGLQYWWLSWFYHVGIILAIIGFFLTALFAFEKDVLLYPDKAETISLYSKETRWNKFLRDRDIEIPEETQKDEYTLTLKEFMTEYYQGLRIDYPEGKLERLLLGMGIKKIEPSQKGFSFMPKMWLTRLEVRKPDGKVLNAELWVNKPFRTGGLTLYQMGYEQKAEISVHPVRKPGQDSLSNGVNGEVIEVEARVPFQAKDVKGKFVLGSLKLGTLYKKDGTKEKITPVTTVYYIPEDAPDKREVLGELRLSSSLDAKGMTFKFINYKEASYLSYRKDPGVWLVGIACLFVFLGLFVRSFGAWYRAQFAVDENKDTYILLSTRGILADKDRIIKKLLKPS